MATPDVPGCSGDSNVELGGDMTRNMGWILPLIKMTCSLLADPLKKEIKKPLMFLPEKLHYSSRKKGELNST